MAQKEFTISIDSFGGFAPAYFENDNPYYGNKDQASDMKNMDITDPNVLKPGPGLKNLVDSGGKGSVSLLRGILKTPTEKDISYAIGDFYLHQITPNTIVHDSKFPHPIGSFVTGQGLPTEEKEEDGKGAYVWTNPENAYLDNGLYATAEQGDQKTHIWHNFKIDADSPLIWEIPVGSVIKGIEVEVKAMADSGTDPELSISLTKNKNDSAGTKITDKLTTTPSVYKLGSGEDLWGGTWGQADFGENFGVIVNGTKSASPEEITYLIDYIKIRVYYSTEDYYPTIKGEDVISYKKDIFYTYNYENADNELVGDIGRYDGTSFIDNFGSIKSEHFLAHAPHQMINGGDDEVYFTNGNHIGRIVKSAVTGFYLIDDVALDFWEDSEAVSLSWNNNRVVIAINRPNIEGSFSQSGIYNWDGVASSWQGDPIEVSGRIGALYTKNGVTFVWWQDSIDRGAYNFGYIQGMQLYTVKRFSGSLPLYYQVGEYKGLVAWASEDKIFLWGSKDPELAVTMSQYISSKGKNIEGIGSPFGELLISSYILE